MSTNNYLKNSGLEYPLSIDGRLSVPAAGGDGDDALGVRYDAVSWVYVLSKQLQHLSTGVATPLTPDLSHVQLQQVV